jgi:N-acetylmuramic acid 6-phosphate etherase
MSGEVPERGHITTERANPRTRGLDALPLAEALARVQDEDAAVHDAIAAARPEILAAIELVVERLGAGGRLFYVGAGTSGRLGVLDAVELPPTFQTDPDLVQGVLAGGEGAMFRAVEGAEDSAEDAARELAARGLGAGDVVLGITAGGTTPFVHGAVAAARAAGAASVFFACVPREEAPDDADVSIRVVTGPEVLRGSTRLKAGTATKLVLNQISTLAMTRLGKVHDNLMVDVNTGGNVKLLDRGIRLVAELCELDRGDARAALEAAGGHVKLAVVMARLGLDADGARGRLAAAGGHLRRALGELG